MKRLLMVAIVLLGACATPAPTPILTGAPPVDPAPMVTATPTLTAPPGPVVQVGDWSVTCGRVSADYCQGVAGLFVNNLARNWRGVLEQSGGMLSVERRPDCPVLPDWADHSACWQASAGAICMVVVRRTVPRPLGFGQVGGDDLTGRAFGPPDDWPTCT